MAPFLYVIFLMMNLLMKKSRSHQVFLHYPTIEPLATFINRDNQPLIGLEHYVCFAEICIMYVITKLNMYHVCYAKTSETNICAILRKETEFLPQKL